MNNITFKKDILQLNNFLKESATHANPLDIIAVNWWMKWLAKARPSQLTPGGKWHYWLILTGRGFGKTLLGANDLGLFGYRHPKSRLAVVSTTFGDVRSVCFEGETGLLNVIPPELVARYNAQTVEITLHNGTLIKGYTAQEPEKSRGHQFHRVWCDELASWINADETWDNIQMGNRLGNDPRTIITTTPKPTDIIRRILNDPDTKLTSGSSYENARNLPKKYLENLQRYEGTMLGRQEIHGEVLPIGLGGIFDRKWFKIWPRYKQLPEFDWVLISFDTAFTEKTFNTKTREPDFTACIVFALFKEKLEDGTKVNSLILCDTWQDRLSFPELREKTVKQFERTYNKTRPELVLIEEKGSGISLIQEMNRLHIPVRAYNPGNVDKMQRAHVVSPLVKSGMIYILESSEEPGEPIKWSREFLDQVTNYAGPGSVKHDDFVDAFTQGLRYMRDSGMLIYDYEKPEPIYYQAPVENPYAS